MTKSTELRKKRYDELELTRHLFGSDAYDAVLKRGTNLKYVEELTENLCMSAVYKDSEALKFVPDHLKTERVCLEAVSKNGLVLQYINSELQTKAICLAALNNNENSLKYISSELFNKIYEEMKKEEEAKASPIDQD